MAPKDLDKLIEKYLAGECNEQERELVDSWYAALGKFSPPASQSLGEGFLAAELRILRNLKNHVVAGQALSEETSRSFLWRYVGIAASILLVISAVFYFPEGSDAAPVLTRQETPPSLVSVENTTRTVKRVILPDGTLVEVSPSGKIRYTTDIHTESRELYLEGEAYFDVARNPDRPFYVYAGDIVTRVLGTSFIIRAARAHEKVTVSVKTGSVTVYSKKTSHKKTLLAPNQEVVYDRVRDLLSTHVVPVQRPDDVKRNFNEMHFEETSVSEVLKILVRTYDIDILFDAAILSDCVLTSSFYEEGLYDRIDVICTAIGATYKIVDAQIVIESNGCNLKPI